MADACEAKHAPRAGAEEEEELSHFIGDAHRSYIRELGDKKSEFEYVMTEHLRVSGIYWGLTAMDILGSADQMKLDLVVPWVLSCQDAETGGFGGNAGHDPHMLYTTSAVQILAVCDRLDALEDPERVVAFVAGLQQPDGSFAGDKWLEIDTRFSYCALLTLAILGRLDAVDVAKATAFVQRCQNFDGGYGAVPGAESHGGQIFCCVGALAIGHALDYIDRDLLAWWLCERQCDSGGLNGRPEKQADVCYSWWNLSCLSILGRVDWIDKDKLVSFILNCQDPTGGGIRYVGDGEDGEDGEGRGVSVWVWVWVCMGVGEYGEGGGEVGSPHTIVPFSEALKRKGVGAARGGKIQHGGGPPSLHHWIEAPTFHPIRLSRCPAYMLTFCILVSTCLC